MQCFLQKASHKLQIYTTGKRETMEGLDVSDAPALKAFVLLR